MSDVRRIPMLKIERGKKPQTLILTDSGGVRHEVTCQFEEGKAVEIREGLKRNLTRMKELLHREEDDPKLTVKDASEALRILARWGISMMVSLFGNERETVQNLFRQSYPRWLSGSGPVVITAAADLSHFLPLEFLPIFEISKWTNCADWPTLAQAVRRFPGFSAIIRREFYNLRVPQDLTLKRNPRLPLKCFIEQDLPGALEEVEFFKGNHGIEFDGPWPDTPIEEFADHLAKYLQFSNQTFTGDLRSHGDQIQHFVCHCNIDEKVPSESELIFSKNNIVTISDLHESLTPPSRLEQREPGPLIFLNACGSAEMNPMWVTSFPQFFLRDNGNRGFIGTETNVPDQFAADFSRCFYESLLNGVRLGEAVNNAKWKMLEQANNPLGILYTIYADPDIVVKNTGV